jgi:hypothetical protein
MGNNNYSYFIGFKLFNISTGKDDISRTAIYHAITYQVWNDENMIFRTYFGKLVTESEAYIRDRVDRWNNTRLPIYQ